MLNSNETELTYEYVAIVQDPNVVFLSIQSFNQIESNQMKSNIKK